MNFVAVLVAMGMGGVGLLAVGTLVLLVRFNRGRRTVERQWNGERVRPLDDIGTTASLEVLPLSDWNVHTSELQGEAGVSYLIRTDTITLLFDLGLNQRQTDPSPLLHNMRALGVSPEDVDTIFISHNHPDHVGGMPWTRQRTFSLTARQIELGAKAVYVPEPMTYPGVEPITVEAPMRIADGVASIGVIPNQLFFLGWTREQALAVNVAGKGIVLIVGCGHQTLSKIVARARALFEAPIYGVIGGLHYPVTEGRLEVLGVPVQRFVGTGKPPWRPITRQEVERDIAILRELEPQVVALSPHDSCDASIEQFRSAFASAYRDVRVGEVIAV